MEGVGCLSQAKVLPICVMIRHVKVTPEQSRVEQSKLTAPYDHSEIME